jgi:hypothetical protein
MTRKQPPRRALGWALGLVGLSFVGCSSTPLVPPLIPPAGAAAAPAAATTATTTIIAVAPAPAPSCSLPQFLGIPQLFQGTFGLFRQTRDCLAAQLGTFFPGLEPKPPLKLLTDPANLSPDAPPSVQAAAEIKAKEDQAAQKAKAVAYLATVGCGCYEGVAEALAESLKDCSEEVRYATVKALRDLGLTNCSCCGGNSCCTVEVHKELMRLAWETDESGCFVERSQRVRRLARLALETCCEPIVDPNADPAIPEEGPEEGEGGDAPATPAAPEAVPPPPPEPATAAKTVPARSWRDRATPSQASQRTTRTASAPAAGALGPVAVSQGPVAVGQRPATSNQGMVRSAGHRVPASERVSAATRADEITFTPTAATVRRFPQSGDATVSAR